MQNELVALGAPAHVAEHLATDPHYTVLPPGFWARLVLKYGPKAFEVLAEILAAKQGDTVPAGSGS